MPYYDDSTVDDYNASIEETCTELSAQHGLNVQLFPIMRVNAPTGDLIQDIFQKIDRCSIFIADITTNNANVLYEFGYAKGKGKDYILLLNKDKKPNSPEIGLPQRTATRVSRLSKPQSRFENANRSRVKKNGGIFNLHAEVA